ncbi:cobalamin biosynthesis protein [Corynebacterium sp. 153RC1]|uniref:CobD/CbiB family cobalamin biosynthesis protein n=1 Tax=unclassified Corynebacterium TaxID=2624378 RepID=UPI00211C67F9|nr:MULTISPECIES: CobD/CbiB family cobalamin biosynthesis protein [unclassified Corynebacterium]MCQ9352326.1 cobalamin biosynthesis protein [Corynebacterium sp. 209RC1]MCQ9354284.1 cobalamin biosynthesis protein [Corynebacterium sp. 1222RC1]MCQ9356566.1 cobalamin biosynthesis protein [Corynebacterium sp. 122RC1]MCQ9358850.1 cobalamin biosynthesis protein [Corynebacterium sp. 142RC1]MCQ9360518.1 cobalamin biosynthesis protein [Corynebacterium sp. 153RC1]
MAADRVLGDPLTPWHPVALYGAYAAWLERKLYADTKLRGAVYVVAAVAPPVAAACWAARKAPNVALAVSVAAALGGTTLERTGMKMAAALESAREQEARELVPWLCSRDPALLDAEGMARATVESLAENTSDAAIAPIIWAFAGAPGVVLHRCVNTLDAMVGYRSERYQNFGFAAAKLDDALAFIPARATALTHLGIATSLGRGKQALRAWRHDAPCHPSPNAGPVEATAAAALGVQLGGRTEYSYGVEMRPVMGAGKSPTISDVRKAVRLSRAVQLTVGAAVAGGMWMRAKRA